MASNMGNTGIYRVQPDEQGSITFGEYIRSTRWVVIIPFPIETVLKPKVTRENQVEVDKPQIKRLLASTVDVMYLKKV